MEIWREPPKLLPVWRFTRYTLVSYFEDKLFHCQRNNSFPWLITSSPWKPKHKVLWPKQAAGYQCLLLFLKCNINKAKILKLTKSMAWSHNATRTSRNSHLRYLPLDGGVTPSLKKIHQSLRVGFKPVFFNHSSGIQGQGKGLSLQ